MCECIHKYLHINYDSIEADTSFDSCYLASYDCFSATFNIYYISWRPLVESTSPFHLRATNRTESSILLLILTFLWNLLCEEDHSIRQLDREPKTKQRSFTTIIHSRYTFMVDTICSASDGSSGISHTEFLKNIFSMDVLSKSILSLDIF